MYILLFEYLSLDVLKTSRHFMGRGYPEHFVIGALIGGLALYLMYKKSSQLLKALIIAVAIVTVIGLAKEIVDPYFGRQRDIRDLIFTVLGGVLGAGVAIPIINNKIKGIF